MKQSTLISIDDYALKIVTFSGKGKKSQIKGVFYRKTEGLTSADISQEIRNGLQATGSKSAKCDILISSRNAMTHALEVPSFDPKEIEAIVKLQASRHTPYSKEEIIVSHKNLEQVEGQHTRVLLVIVPKQAVEREIEVLTNAGVVVGAMRVSFDAVTLGLSELGILQPDDFTGVIVIDESHTDVIIAHHDKPYFVRNIGIGAKDLKQGNQESVFIEEIKKSLDSYQASSGKANPHEIIVLGPAIAQIDALAASIKAKTGAEVEIEHVAETMDFSQQAKEQAGEYAKAALDNVLIGGVVGESLSMDLIPDEMGTRRAFQERAQQFFTAGTLALVIFVTILGFFLTKLYFQSSYIKALDKNFASRNSEAEKLLALSEQNRLIRDFEGQKGKTLSALTSLEKTLPGQMYLNEFDVNVEGRVIMKGTSELMSRVFSFVTEFENTDTFQNVNTDYAKSRKLDDRDVTDFGLTAYLQEEV